MSQPDWFFMCSTSVSERDLNDFLQVQSIPMGSEWDPNYLNWYAQYGHILIRRITDAFKHRSPHPRYGQTWPCVLRFYRHSRWSEVLAALMLWFHARVREKYDCRCILLDREGTVIFFDEGSSVTYGADPRGQFRAFAQPTLGERSGMEISHPRPDLTLFLSHPWNESRFRQCIGLEPSSIAVDKIDVGRITVRPGSRSLNGHPWHCSVLFDFPSAMFPVAYAIAWAVCDGLQTYCRENAPETDQMFVNGEGVLVSAKLHTPSELGMRVQDLPDFFV